MGLCRPLAGNHRNIVSRTFRPCVIPFLFCSLQEFDLICSSIEDCWDIHSDARLSAECLLQRFAPLSSSSYNANIIDGKDNTTSSSSAGLVVKGNGYVKINMTSSEEMSSGRSSSAGHLTKSSELDMSSGLSD